MKLKSVLFVCLGNICRSPSAEAVFRKLVEDKGLAEGYNIDSAGIIGAHAGEKADSRMRAIAARRGYCLTSISRQIKRSDFEKFDIILGMDQQNIRDLNSLARTDAERAKIHLLSDFCKKGNPTSVPDPYYGGEEGFELVIDLLEDACAELLDYLER